MLCNILVPQALWSGWVRSKPVLLFIIALIVNAGMWLERYVIIVVSLHRDYLPSSWGMYSGTIWDWATFIGTIGLFLTLIFLFIRVLPMISIFEMRHLLAETHKHAGTSPVAEAVAVETATPTLAPDPDAPLYGLMAEFADPETLLAKAQATYAAGYRRLSAYSPFAIAELPAAIGLRPSRLGWLVLVGGIVGAVVGFGMQYYAAVIDYPWNIGGRPLNSWPSFIILTFEMTILFAAGSAVLGMLLRNGLPRPYHAVFNAPRFKFASQDRFFLCVEADDPKFDLVQTRQFLVELGSAEVVAVEK